MPISSSTTVRAEQVQRRPSDTTPPALVKLRASGRLHGRLEVLADLLGLRGDVTETGDAACAAAT